MGRWQLLKEIRAAMKDPARIGDVPTLKSELARARARSAIEKQLDEVRGYHPVLEVEALSQLPPATFGHQYARFLRANDLTPIALTGNLPRDMIERNAFVARYGAIHDMVHVLTGFDTSWPGEIGVWAFVGAQNYSLGFRFTAWVALAAALVRCPLRLGRAVRCFRRGRALGRGARPLIALKLEERLSSELRDVRESVGLPADLPSAVASR